VIAASATPKRNERVAARVVEGKALIVVIDQKQLHTLNEVGTRVWELCDGRSVDAIADAVVDEFEVDKQTAMRDVQRFVDELRALGALELEARP
jgi:pyrroloquinoline quinone biosynthesis protein D